MNEQIISVLREILNIDLREIIVSNPIDKDGVLKVKVRPVLLQNNLLFQVESFIGKQVFHSNKEENEAMSYLEDLIENKFKQTEIRTKEFQYTILVSKKKKVTIKKRKNTDKDSKNPIAHNREKEYLLKQGVVVPFLVDLGIMTPEGKIVNAKYDKYKQINRFLEFVEDVVPTLENVLKEKKEITIIDFGCGKSYLTFAMYYYLKIVKNYNIRIIGLDLKSDVITHCNECAKRYGYEKLTFLHGDIATYEGVNVVDMVVTLHACDTATDYALYKAYLWGAKVILSVPCCQHEVNRQIKNEKLVPVLKYGLIKERTASLVTDGLRASLLEILGYKAQVLEFIDMEHTPKNILIRAIYSGTNKNKDKMIKEYEDCLKAFNVNPTLYQLCKERF